MLKQIFGPILLNKLDRLGTFAAALAYCFVLSFIPFLVLTFTLGSWIAEAIDSRLDLGRAYIDLLNQLPKNTGVSSAVEVIRTVQNTAHRGLFTAGLVLAAYTSYNLMGQMVRTLLFIFDTHRQVEAWTLMAGLKTVLLLLIWMTILLLISTSTVVNPILTQMLQQTGVTSQLAKRLVSALGDIVIIGTLPLAFLFTFWIVPEKRYGWRLLIKGSLLASFGLIACSALFAYLLANIWLTNPLYGALGSVLAILGWAQSCAWCVIIGAAWIVRFSPRLRLRK